MKIKNKNKENDENDYFHFRRELLSLSENINDKSEFFHRHLLDELAAYKKFGQINSTMHVIKTFKSILKMINEIKRNIAFKINRYTGNKLEFDKILIVLNHPHKNFKKVVRDYNKLLTASFIYKRRPKCGLDANMYVHFKSRKRNLLICENFFICLMIILNSAILISKSKYFIAQKRITRTLVHEYMHLFTDRWRFVEGTINISLSEENTISIEEIITDLITFYFIKRYKTKKTKEIPVDFDINLTSSCFICISRHTNYDSLILMILLGFFHENEKKCSDFCSAITSPQKFNLFEFLKVKFEILYDMVKNDDRFKNMKLNHIKSEDWQFLINFFLYYVKKIQNFRSKKKYNSFHRYKQILPHDNLKFSYIKNIILNYIDTEGNEKYLRQYLFVFLILKIVSNYFTRFVDQRKFFNIILLHANKYQGLYEPIYFPLNGSFIVNKNFEFYRENMKILSTFRENVNKKKIKKKK